MWKTIFGTTSFMTGVNSWQIRIDKSSSSYLFIGVANRKANVDTFLGADEHSWGFIGDKALYYQRNRLKSYGDVFGEGDIIGVHLDCDKQTLSFSKNGMMLGIAFENVIGEVFPAVAFYSRHQKVTLVSSSFSCEGINKSVLFLSTTNNKMDNSTTTTSSSSILGGTFDSGSIEESIAVCDLMETLQIIITKQMIDTSNKCPPPPTSPLLVQFRQEILLKAYEMYYKWSKRNTRWVHTCGGFPLFVDVDTSGEQTIDGFKCHERVRTSKGDGEIVGFLDGRIWVELDNNEFSSNGPNATSHLLGGGQLGNAWYFHPSKLRSIGMKCSFQEKEKEEEKEEDTTTTTMSLQEFTESLLQNMSEEFSFVSIVGTLNEYCEKHGTIIWNLSISQIKKILLHQVKKQYSKEMLNILFARIGLIRFYNYLMSRTLSYFDLTWHFFNPQKALRPAQLVSKTRCLLFTSIKNRYFEALLDRTAVYPKKNDDEYDYPEEVPLLVINRPRAALAKCKKEFDLKLTWSLFGQSFEELHFLSNQTLRMLYSHPMDDGQWRNFKVKFEGEGVDDYGGPYREFFSQFFAELQLLKEKTSTVKTKKENDPQQTDPHSSNITECILPFFLPCPNWRNGVGDNREKFVLNTALLNVHSKWNYGLSNMGSNRRDVEKDLEEEEEQLEQEDKLEKEEQDKEDNNLEVDTWEESIPPMDRTSTFSEMFYFLGQMLAICLRTRVCVRLDWSMSIWKQLVCQEPFTREEKLNDLKEIDFVTYQFLKNLDQMVRNTTSTNASTTSSNSSSNAIQVREELEAMDLTFTTYLSDGQLVELIPNGSSKSVTIENLQDFIDLTLDARFKENDQVINLIQQGIHSILPISALHLMTWKEMEAKICGVEEVDIELLKQNTEYDEDLSVQDESVQRFWRVMEQLGPQDKTAFLRFVWARSRLPVGASQFHQKFKIQSAVPGATITTAATTTAATVTTTTTNTTTNTTTIGGPLSGSNTMDPATSTSTTTMPIVPPPPSGGSGTTCSGYMDGMLPKSHTCFFALQLPRYSTDEICKRQILYAIHNCLEMDGDFRLGDAEMTGWTEITGNDSIRF
jgi:hypothetical protein